MRALIMISIRNLFRQKRRYLLLGTAVALGTVFLLIASAFAHGISNALFDRVVSTFTGHVTISILRDGYQGASVFNNREKLMNILSSKLSSVSSIYESITGYARIMGNGKSDNCFLTGIVPEADTPRGFKMVDGDLFSLKRNDLENPVILSVKQANLLNVKTGDILHARYTDIYGQYQTARLTVSGTCVSTSFLTDMQVIIRTDDLKSLFGFKHNDCGPVFVIIKDPKKRAARVADSLHTFLKPPVAAIKAKVEGKHQLNRTAAVYGIKTDSLSLKILNRILHISSGDCKDESFWKDAVLISDDIAETLQLKTGDTCRISWKPQYEKEPFTIPVIISSIYSSDSLPSGTGLLINEKAFYSMYYDHWPLSTKGISEIEPSAESFLAPEWILLPRNKSTSQMSQRYWDLFQNPPKAVAIDVMSMYESGSAVTGIEGALKLLSFCMVLILFFIIQIGVINTLRLIVRERTGEIGTMRAIGMQKKDIRRVFTLEISFLALLSSLSGAVLSLIIIMLLKTIKITTEGPFTILLTDGHLPLSPSACLISGYIAFIVFIAAAVSWFPARKAANLSPAAALRSVKN